VPGERGPHHTRWINVQPRTNSAGRVFFQTNSFIELGTGVNRWDGNQWVAATPEINPAPGGAVGNNGQHQVRFASNLNTPGTIELTGPDGRRIRSHLLGLSYYDTASGSNVLIAVTKPSQGQVLPSKTQVLYADGLAGVNADILYTYSVTGLRQDVIARAQLPAPEDYGLNAQTTELEVLTEYLDLPTRHKVGAAGDEIQFGAMHLAAGPSLLLGPATGELRVTNRWAQVSGRQILIESVAAAAARQATAQLPKPHASLLKPSARSGRELPALPKASEGAESMLMARAAPAEPGFVLDWLATLDAETLDSYTFQAGTEYLITNVCSVLNARFEGGTVVKFSDGSALLVSNIVTTATQYEPVTFTSQQDTSVGWDISTGDTNAWAGVGFRLLICVPEGVATLANMRFRGAGIAVSLLPLSLDIWDMSSSEFVNCALDLWDCQFVNCTIGLLAKQVTLHNVLFSGCQFPVGSLGHTNSLLTGEHVTADGFTAFYVGLFDSGPHLCLTNSILTGGGLLTAIQDTNGNWVAAGSADTNQVFCTNYADAFLFNYYLPTNSSLHGAGTASISPDLARDLSHKTTWPPCVLADTNVGGATQPVITLSPTAPKDTNACPDPGYHYPPMDYLIDYLVVTNATLVVTQGTVIGYVYTEGAIWLGDGATIQCTGNPLARNTFVSYAAIIEQPISVGDRSADSFSRIINSSRPNGGFARGTFRFTDFLQLPGNCDLLSADSGSGFLPLHVRDCRLVNGNVSWLPAIAVTNDVENNLFEYGSLHAEQPNAGGLTLVAHNNLFHNTSVYLATESGWIIQDNAFDAVTNFQINVGTSITLDHSAYLNGAAWPTNFPPGTSDIVTNLTWVAATNGNYYQPLDSALIGGGSTNADALGLSEYTVLTTLLAEGTNTVAIGLHYPGGVYYPGIVITQQPTNQTVVVGSNATFSVEAAGVGLTYQWQVSTNSGTTFAHVSATATNASYSTPQTRTTDDGKRYRALVRDSLGQSAVTSHAALFVSWAWFGYANAVLEPFICRNGTAPLSGSLGPGTECTWVGEGSFSPTAAQLSVNYTPSEDEIANGTATVTLNASNPASGWEGSIQVAFSIIQPATVSAGPNQTVCAASPATQLAGWVEGTEDSEHLGGDLWWWYGAGTFVPGPWETNAVYVPTADEIAAGRATLTLEAYGPSPCWATDSTTTITINPEATASAGANQTVWATNPVVQLAGAFGGAATSATWSGAGTLNYPNLNVLTPTYTPTAAEVWAGHATVTLTTDDPPGPCGPVSSAMAITINAATLGKPTPYPSNPTTDMTPTGLYLRWSAVTNADGYCIDLYDFALPPWNANPGVEVINLDVGNATNWFDFDGLPGYSWYFRVRAYSTNACSQVKHYGPRSDLMMVSNTLSLPSDAALYYYPETAQVTWADTNGPHTGNLYDFTNNQYLSTVSAIYLTNQETLTLAAILTANLPSLLSVDLSSNNLLTNVYCFGSANSSLTTLTVLNDPNLVSLACALNPSLTTLTVSNNPILLFLDCLLNNLTNLDVTGDTSLERLNVYGNALATMDISTCSNLGLVDLGGNPVVSLDTSYNPKLSLLAIGADSALTALDFRFNPALKYLQFPSDAPGLTNLDLSFNPLLECIEFRNGGNLQELKIASESLVQMTCLKLSGCQVSMPDTHSMPNLMYLTVPQGTTSLDISENPLLNYLNCSQSSLPSLVVSNTPWLDHLDCSGCGLTTLDISQNTNLVYLDASRNSIGNLSVAHSSKLEYLCCSSCGLASLNISQNRELGYLDARNNAITDPNVIDTILGYLDDSGLSFSFFSPGYVGLSGGSNAPPPDPDETGNRHVKNLEDRGWIVETN
jgi:hypothetical protein